MVGLDPTPFATILPLALAFGVGALALLWKRLLLPLGAALPSVRRPFWSKLLEGMGWAALLLVLNVGPILLTQTDRQTPGWQGFMHEVPRSGPAMLGPLAGYFLLQSLTEELKFRAFLL